MDGSDVESLLEILSNCQIKLFLAQSPNCPSISLFFCATLVGLLCCLKKEDQSAKTDRKKNSADPRQRVLVQRLKYIGHLEISMFFFNYQNS